MLWWSMQRTMWCSMLCVLQEVSQGFSQGPLTQGLSMSQVFPMSQTAMSGLSQAELSQVRLWVWHSLPVHMPSHHLGPLPLPWLTLIVQRTGSCFAFIISGCRICFTELKQQSKWGLLQHQISLHRSHLYATWGCMLCVVEQPAMSPTLTSTRSCVAIVLQMRQRGNWALSVCLQDSFMAADDFKSQMDGMLSQDSTYQGDRHFYASQLSQGPFN